MSLVSFYISWKQKTFARSRILVKWTSDRSSPPELFLGKGALKICSKFTGEHPCRNVISIKLQSNFTEITLRHGCSVVNLLHIIRTPFPNNTSDGLLLQWPTYSKAEVWGFMTHTQALTLSLLLKLPTRKLEPWFVPWSAFLLRLLCISINLRYGHVCNTVVKSGLVLLAATWNCQIS